MAANSSPESRAACPPKGGELPDPVGDCLEEVVPGVVAVGVVDLFEPVEVDEHGDDRLRLTGCGGGGVDGPQAGAVVQAG